MEFVKHSVQKLQKETRRFAGGGEGGIRRALGTNPPIGGKLILQRVNRNVSVGRPLMRQQNARAGRIAL